MTLTIITATQNSATTIQKCLVSIGNIRLGGVSLEHLVIDGDSTDSTLKTVSTVSGNIRVMNQTSKGLYQALNEAVRGAGGNYIMFLHSDDEIGKVDLRQIDLQPNVVVYGTVEFIDDSSKLLFRRRAPLFPKQCLSQYPFVFHPNAIYPRWLLLKYPFDSDSYGNAADMWQINTFRNEVKFVPTAAITYRFRIHKQSTTVKSLGRKFPMIYWIWRVYLFLFFEDHRLARVSNLFRGKRTWS
jgi:glycosyltransferase involved in cell wall biosynthesis